MRSISGLSFKSRTKSNQPVDEMVTVRRQPFQRPPSNVSCADIKSAALPTGLPWLHSNAGQCRLRTNAS